MICNYNLGQSVYGLFHLWAKFPSTTSEKELNYYHQKGNGRVASQVVEWLDLES